MAKRKERRQEGSQPGEWLMAHRHIAARATVLLELIYLIFSLAARAAAATKKSANQRQKKILWNSNFRLITRPVNGRRIIVFFLFSKLS
jgi:hypothetical protein